MIVVPYIPPEALTSLEAPAVIRPVNEIAGYGGSLSYGANSPLPRQELGCDNWKNVLSSYVSGLASLEAGWDGPKSGPVARKVLYEANRIVRVALEGCGLAQAPFLVPGADGSVQIEWHEERYQLQLELGVFGERLFELHDYHTGVTVRAVDDRAVDLFLRWAPRVATHDQHVGNATAAPAATALPVAA